MNESKISKNTFALISIIAIVFILYILQSVLIPILLAIMLSVMLYPATKFLERKFRFNRMLSAITVLLLFIFITLGLFAFIGFQLTEILSKGDVYSKRLTEISAEVSKLISSNFNIDIKKIISNKNFKIEEIIKTNFSKITDFISASGGIIANGILIILYIFFFFYYRKFFINFIHKVFPSKNNSYLNIVLKKIYITQQYYLLGMVTVMGIVGGLNTIGLLLLGIENAFFFGFLGAFLLLIPYIGIIIGSLLPALVALATKDSAWYALGVIGIFGFVQFLEGNFITPKITASKVSINAFISILSLLLFSMLWGIGGMILALPVTATMKIIFEQIPSLRAYAFLLSEPEDHFTERTVINRLKKWKKIRAEKNKMNK